MNSLTPATVSLPFDPRNIMPEVYLARAVEAGLPEPAARRWLGAVVGRGEHTPDRLLAEGGIAKRFAPFLGELPRLALSNHVISPTDGFEKLVFSTAEGLKLETVIIPLHKQGAVSVCLSSQIGCVMGCAFCATARMRERRNLAAWEIVDQFVQAKLIVRSQGRRVTGAVFMGMGEPFLNYTNVLTAARHLRFPVEGAISGKAITISTVGLVPEIVRFADENLPYRLSISLGAATDEKRAQLVPVAARTPIREVITAARYYALKRRDRINLAYVCVSGHNVGVEDARALGELIGDTPVRLDLIDVTDHSGRFSPPTPEELQTFRDALGRYVRQPVARRYSGGADIRASCGSLAAQG